MGTYSTPVTVAGMHPVHVHVQRTLANRNRLTVAFRPLLAIPHLILVGGPLATTLWWTQSDAAHGAEWGMAGGAFGALAGGIAVVAWFSILFTGRYPVGLWRLAAMYLRWRVRASAYLTLLRDEYPPFGDDPYPARLALQQPPGERDRVSVGFRLLLAIPQLFAVALLGMAWALSTLAAWVAIVFTGRLPVALFRFGEGALRWTTRVEAYLLLLHDEYPPFSLE